MNSLLPGLLFASALCLTGPVHGKELAQKIRIHLYDQAQVPSDTLHFALAEANRVYKAAGIELIWERPAAGAEEAQGTDMSSRPGESNTRSHVAVRIIRGMPGNCFPGALGYALPHARAGANVSIFFDRVETFSAQFIVASYVVLGDAMAHEIGHVLLRSPEHSAGGLMRARWDPNTWRMAASGLLSFDKTQVRRIRESVLQGTVNGD